MSNLQPIMHGPLGGGDTDTIRNAVTACPPDRDVPLDDVPWWARAAGAPRDPRGAARERAAVSALPTPQLDELLAEPKITALGSERFAPLFTAGTDPYALAALDELGGHARRTSRAHSGELTRPRGVATARTAAGSHALPIYHEVMP